VSDDQKTWRPLTSLKGDEKPSAVLDIAAPASTAGRFVRLHFQDVPPNASIQLAEFEVTGTLKSQ